MRESVTRGAIAAPAGCRVLLRLAYSGPLGGRLGRAATTRNWATVGKLRALLGS